MRIATRHAARTASLCAALITPFAVAPAPAATAAGACAPVSGDVTAIAVPQFDTSGQLVGFHDIFTSVTGPLGGGSASADLAIAGGTPGGVLMLSGSHQYTDTSLGMDVVTRDRVVVTPTAIVNSTLAVVSGGGGTLHDHGTIDLATGQLTLHYTGVVCG